MTHNFQLSFFVVNVKHYIRIMTGRKIHVKILRGARSSSWQFLYTFTVLTPSYSCISRSLASFHDNLMERTEWLKNIKKRETPCFMKSSKRQQWRLRRKNAISVQSDPQALAVILQHCRFVFISLLTYLLFSKGGATIAGLENQAERETQQKMLELQLQTKRLMIVGSWKKNPVSLT